MNQLGRLVDVSRVSNAKFRDILATTTLPVIASHSSCRALAHHPRNLSDQQLRAIAENGGVVGINFYPVFLDEHFRSQYEEMRRRLKPQTDSIRAHYRGRPGESAFEVDKFVGQHAESLDVPTIDRLMDHIDHRSEEHTSELQSQSNLVCRLLLEKKKKLLIRTLGRVTSNNHPSIHHSSYSLVYHLQPETQQTPYPRIAKTQTTLQQFSEDRTHI